MPTAKTTDTLVHCSRCALHAAMLGELRDIPTEIAWQDLPIVRRTGAGKFLAMVPDRQFDGLYLFDSLGRFEKTIGRRGPGPGELQHPVSFVVDAADTVHVLDNGRRISVLTLDGKGIREVRTAVTLNSELGITNSFVSLSNGSYVASANSVAGSFAGIPLFTLGTHGEILKAFGTPNLSTMGSRSTRVLAHGADAGRIWVAEPTNYRLEELSTSDGTVTRVIALAAPWFDQAPVMTKAEAEKRFADARVEVVKTDLKSRPGKVTTPPRTALRGMQFANDKLWLLWQLPAPRWDTVTTIYPFAEEMRLSTELNDQLWVSVVDVIDVEQGTLHARRYFPFHAHFIAAGYLGHSYYAKSGEPIVDIWRMSVATDGATGAPTK